MSMVKFSPTAVNFGYDFVLLVHFFGTPCMSPHVITLRVLLCEKSAIYLHQCTLMCFDVLQCTSMFFNVLQFTLMYFNVLQYTSMYLNVSYVRISMYLCIYFNLRLQQIKLFIVVSSHQIKALQNVIQFLCNFFHSHLIIFSPVSKRCLLPRFRSEGLRFCSKNVVLR